MSTFSRCLHLPRFFYLGLQKRYFYKQQYAALPQQLLKSQKYDKTPDLLTQSICSTISKIFPNKANKWLNKVRKKDGSQTLPNPGLQHKKVTLLTPPATKAVFTPLFDFKINFLFPFKKMLPESTLKSKYKTLRQVQDKLQRKITISSPFSYIVFGDVYCHLIWDGGTFKKRHST